jgi:hypothetical protein
MKPWKKSDNAKEHVQTSKGVDFEQRLAKVQINAIIESNPTSILILNFQ